MTPTSTLRLMSTDDAKPDEEDARSVTDTESSSADKDNALSNPASPLSSVANTDAHAAELEIAPKSAQAQPDEELMGRRVSHLLLVMQGLREQVAETTENRDG
jgi:hypothetical protein